MSKKGTGKLILGAGLGAGLALLFAPKKGSELREDLKCKINELVNKAKEVDTEEVKENLENKIDEIKEEIGMVIEGLDALKIAHDISQKYNINTKIINTLYDIIYNEKSKESIIDVVLN